MASIFSSPFRSFDFERSARSAAVGRPSLPFLSVFWILPRFRSPFRIRPPALSQILRRKGMRPASLSSGQKTRIFFGLKKSRSGFPGFEQAPAFPLRP
jgi:hypothetical protein